MTARVITGSKQQIADQVNQLEGDVREAIVFIEERTDRITTALPAAVGTVEELFAEMDAFASAAAEFDDSREAIYRPVEGE